MKAEQFEKDLGKKLEMLRKAKGKTQAEVAEELGLNSRETIKQWETWDRHIKAHDLIKLSQYYGVSSDYLLGISDVIAPDPDLKVVCEYTGLSEKAIQIITLCDIVPRAINRMAETPAFDTEENNPTKSPLFNYATSFVGIEKAAVPASITMISDDPNLSYVEADMTKKDLELALYRFEKVCRELPSTVFYTSAILDKLGSMTQELYLKELQAFISERKGKEATDGEHQED